MPWAFRSMVPELPIFACPCKYPSGDWSARCRVADFPDAVASDPTKLGWMVGSPPPADKQLRFDDGSYFRFPALR